jgi:hypothetical protein
MKTNLPPPPHPAAKMADELLSPPNLMILDHYSELPETARRITSEPKALLLEMWEAGRRLAATKYVMAKARPGALIPMPDGGTMNNPDLDGELTSEAYAAIFPATESNESLPGTRRKLDDWLERLATEG